MKRMAGFQKPASNPGENEVNFAVLSFSVDTMHGAHCSCGWSFRHKRKKVVDDAAERHLDKQHQGRGIWT